MQVGSLITCFLALLVLLVSANVPEKDIIRNGTKELHRIVGRRAVEK